MKMVGLAFGVFGFFLVGRLKGLNRNGVFGWFSYRNGLLGDLGFLGGDFGFRGFLYSSCTKGPRATPHRAWARSYAAPKAINGTPFVDMVLLGCNRRLHLRNTFLMSLHGTPLK